jgi:hypothetical protein
MSKLRKLESKTHFASSESEVIMSPSIDIIYTDKSLVNYVEICMWSMNVRCPKDVTI